MLVLCVFTHKYEQGLLLTFFCFSSGTIALDIVDAPGVSSWPMASMYYLTLASNATLSDCNPMQQVLLFLSWTQLNDNAANWANSNYYTALSNPVRR